MNDEKLQTFKSLTFGTELEYEQISRRRMASAIQSVVGGTITEGGPHVFIIFSLFKSPFFRG